MPQRLVEDCKKQLESINTNHEIQNLKSHFLGKNGVINQNMLKLKDASIEEKKKLGSELNEIKERILTLIEQKHKDIEESELRSKLEMEALDVSIPGQLPRMGSIHPISQALDEMMQIFSHFGFSVSNGPNIEDEWHNFDALNFPEYHPAKTMHDTFYLKSGKLLRTHTSTVEIRAMTGSKPPFKLVAFGRTYRSDSDMTHTPMFHQVEGLVIDKDINMAHMKNFLHQFVELFFEQKVNVRLRPSYFPFTEPSAEMDISMSNGKDKWLEVMGCGMTHPNVLKNVGINPDIYQGFAFGLGLERFAMLKYGIEDLRQLFNGDIRFINHYSFSGLDVPSIIGGLTR